MAYVHTMDISDVHCCLYGNVFGQIVKVATAFVLLYNEYSHGDNIQKQKKYKDLVGADKVMSVEDDEKIPGENGYKANESFCKIIISEIDRHQ